MNNSKLFGSLVVTAVAGLLASAPAMAGDDKAAGGAHCSPGCSGKSECKGHGNAGCAGQNTCAGQGWMKAKDEAECKSKGGTWKTADAPAPAKEEKKADKKKG